MYGALARVIPVVAQHAFRLYCFRMSESTYPFALLETFVQVAQSRSISSAARSMGLTQPTVSRQLRQLEAFFGVRLALRTTHEFALTDEGQRLVVESRAILDNWERLRDQIRGQPSNPVGVLRAVVPVGLGQTVLVDIIARFQKLFPKVTSELLLTDAPVDLAGLGYDCWIRVGRVSDESLISIPLGVVERILVVAPSLTKRGISRPDQLSSFSFVRLSPLAKDRIELYDERGNRVIVHTRPVFTTDNALAVVRAVQAGLGVGLVATWYAANELRDGRLAQILPKWRAEDLPLTLALPAGRYRPPRISQFVEHLKQELKHVPGIRAVAR